MGQSVTLACPATWSLGMFEGPMRDLAAFIGRGQCSRFNDEQLQVLRDDDSPCVVITPVTERSLAMSEYTTNTDLDARFREFVTTSALFHVRFGELGEARWLLSRIAQAARNHNDELWIDTDFGWAVNGNEFFRVGENPDWSWRVPL